MRPIVLSLALLAMLLIAATSVKPPGGPTVRAPSLDDYRIIVDRNIFARDRAARRTGRPERDRSQETKAPAPEMVLIGMAVQGGEPLAFFEDSRSGEIVQLPSGQELWGGTILSISMDGVDYLYRGTTRYLAIGDNLQGVAAALLSASSMPSSAPSDATFKPSEGGNKPANDMLERLRQRRLQEGR